VLGAIALCLALVEWVQAPAAPSESEEDAPIVRPDPVRALAIEHGLLGAEPAPGAAPEPLSFEPAPEPATAAPGAGAPAALPPPEAAQPAAP
jgi:hypothetical protein